jgi:hypothetical protein
MPFSTSTAAAGRRSSTQHPDSGAVDEPAWLQPPRKHRTAPSTAAVTPSESAADALAIPSLHVHQQPELRPSSTEIKPSHSMIRIQRKALGPGAKPAGGPGCTSSAVPSAAVDAVQPSSTRGAGQTGRAKPPGLLQLTGTEQQLFAQALNYMPPKATAELVEVAEVSG